MTPTDRFFELLVSRYGFRSRLHAEAYCRRIFGDLDLRGLSLLDIGCGKGWNGLYAGTQGAARVIGLEPEFEGSTSGDLGEFRTMIGLLGLDQVEALGKTIQEFSRPGVLFDLIVSRASINHLDEEACIELRRSAEARARYLEIFRHLAAMLRPGGTLIITDSSPYNLFALLGLRNPFARRIEWHKHQPPRVWIDLLLQAGFCDPRVSWKMPLALRPLGRFAANEWVSFLLWSRFRLEMRRA